MEAPLDSHIRVPHTSGAQVPCGSLNDEIGGIYIQFQIVRKAIVELEIGGVLPHIRVLKLEGVIFIEELEVPFSSLGDPGVIGIERQLSVQLLAEAEHTGKPQQ